MSNVHRLPSRSRNLETEQACPYFRDDMIRGCFCGKLSILYYMFYIVTMPSGHPPKAAI